MISILTRKNLIATLASAVALSGCVSTLSPPVDPPQVGAMTNAEHDLLYMPPPPEPVPVAVYSFQDQTGQLKPSDNIQDLSRAVTQGGTSMMVKALQDAGNGNWFTVVEREHLDDLLKERQIITEMRQRYLGETQTPADVLPSLLFAGVLLEGGVIGFDSNVTTGGLGASYLAISASTQYRKSTVTVYLRAVSVKTGEVLANVTTSKTIDSIEARSNVFKFFTYDELGEFESGLTANEPTTVALQEAIEKSVSSLILEGAQKKLWSFYDPAAGQKAVDQYVTEKATASSTTAQLLDFRRPAAQAAPPPAPQAAPPPAPQALLSARPAPALQGVAKPIQAVPKQNNAPLAANAAASAKPASATAPAPKPSTQTGS